MEIDEKKIKYNAGRAKKTNGLFKASTQRNHTYYIKKSIKYGETQRKSDKTCTSVGHK